MDKNKAIAISNRIIKLLKPIEEEFDIKVKSGSGRFSETEFTKKIVFTDRTVVRNGKEMSAAKAEWLKWCDFYGMNKEWYKKKFMFLGREVIIVGIAPGRRRWNIRIKDVLTGKESLTQANHIKSLLDITARA